MINRTTKALLLAIAVGLWMNVASTWLQPVPVQAEAVAQSSRDYRSMVSSLNSIESDLGRIQRGACLNSTIC